MNKPNASRRLRVEKLSCKGEEWFGKNNLATDGHRLNTDKNDSAFTLVEWLVVIAVVGILAALLLAVIVQAKAKAEKIECINNLHQFGVALQNFLANNHGYPTLISNKGDEIGLWSDQLETGGFEVRNSSLSPTNLYLANGVWLCPSAKWSNLFSNSIPISYGYNMSGVGDQNLGIEGHAVPRTKSGPRVRPITESEIVVPSDMMAIGDCFDGSSELARKNVDVLKKYGNTLTRHLGKANVVFCDGHVESPTLQFLFEDTSDEALSRWNRDHQPHREKLSP